MRRVFLGGALFSFALLWQLHAQQIEIPRQAGEARVSFAAQDKEEIIPAEGSKPAVARKQSSTSKITLDDMRKAGALAQSRRAGAGKNRAGNATDHQVSNAALHSDREGSAAGCRFIGRSTIARVPLRLVPVGQFVDRKAVNKP